jgi:hypothetical protein
MVPSYTLICIYLDTYGKRKKNMGSPFVNKDIFEEQYHGICYIYSVKSLLIFGKSLLTPV